MEDLVNEPPAERPYEVLKERLVKSFTFSAKEQAARKEKASKSQNVDFIPHCLDQRASLTPNSVLQLASGRWDGRPFVVQIIPAQSIIEETSITELPFLDLETAIGMTDGDSKMLVDLSSEIINNNNHYKLEAFSIIQVVECDCSYRENTTLHLKRPGESNCRLYRLLDGFMTQP